MGLRIGVIGVGVMGEVHAQTIHGATARARVTAVHDRDAARATAVATDVGAAVLDDPMALITSAEVDAVVVASPNTTHAAFVLAAIEAGKPVLCEKPLATTVADCARIVEAERHCGRPLVQVGFMRRFDPAYVALKAAYDEGRLGACRLLRCIHRNAKEPDFFEPGMIVTNAMVHELDVCRWLLGTEIRRVGVITAGTAAGSSFPGPLLATLETTAGQLVTIEVFMNAGYGYDIRTELVAERGVLEMAPPVLVTTRDSEGDRFTYATDWTGRFADAYRLQMQAWVDGIEKGRPGGGASAMDGLVATLVAEATLESLAAGRAVEVSLPPDS